MKSVLLLSLVCCSTALRLPSDAITSRRAVIAALPAMVPLAAHAGDEVLHIMNYPVDGKCGEALVPEKGVPFVKAFGGFSDGTCAAAGYTVKEGTEEGTGEKDKDREARTRQRALENALFRERLGVVMRARE